MLDIILHEVIERERQQSANLSLSGIIEGNHMSQSLIPSASLIYELLF